MLQLFRTTQSIIFKYEIEEGRKVYETTINGATWEMYDDTVIGLDKNGKEIVRTNVEEPLYVRDAQHVNSI